MRGVETSLPGVIVVEPQAHGDARGFFAETFRASFYADHGIEHEWVQDNHSRSRRGVVRGMHFQTDPGQAKLIRAATGSILDVAVDLRRGSPTYGQWEAHELSEENMRQLYVPVGFAHGFAVTSDVADVVYKCSWYYVPETEAGFRYDDPEVGIAWPEDIELQPSQRDIDAPLLSEISGGLPWTYGPVQEPA